MLDADLEARARAWSADDPDPETQAELSALLLAADGGATDGGVMAEAAVAERFGAQLEFGTAGLRGPLGAGPARMNLVLARRTAAGLAAHLLTTDPASSSTGLVVAHDARRRSADFAADVAAVLAGAGLPAVVLPGPSPTPLLAFAVTHLGCAAGVMVTASHNPREDNGVKVYAGDGAQIVPPTDALIAAAMAAVATVSDLPLGVARTLGDEVLEAYIERAAGLVGHGPRDLRLVHSAMHGVATEPLLRLFRRAGFAEPHLVALQSQPDAAFPTVAFPNPEEPGALDLALAAAAEVQADAVVANDPDADRLAVAVPDGRGGWRALTGDELGGLLADHVLGRTGGADRLVVTTVVSSSLLGRLAEAHGVRFATTLTGFKFVARAADHRPGARFTFGYEEALGYAVSDMVRDKDGLSAALMFAEMAAEMKAEGETFDRRLEGLARRFGLHTTRQWALRLPGVEGATRIAAAVEGMVSSPPSSLAGLRVLATELPAPDVVVLHLDGGARVVVRPSGTEPKLKVYLQVVVSEIGPGPAGWAAAQAEGAAGLEALRAAVARVLALGD